MLKTIITISTDALQKKPEHFEEMRIQLTLIILDNQDFPVQCFQPGKQRDTEPEGEEGVCLKKTWIASS